MPNVALRTAVLIFSHQLELLVVNMYILPGRLPEALNLKTENETFIEINHHGIFSDIIWLRAIRQKPITRGEQP